MGFAFERERKRINTHTGQHYLCPIIRYDGCLVRRKFKVELLLLLDRVYSEFLLVDGLGVEVEQGS